MKITKYLRTREDLNLKRLLHEQINRIDFERFSKKVIHASDLTKEVEFCPRYAVLRGRIDTPARREHISTPLAVTFDLGKDLQRRLNEHWLPDHMVGNWRCKSCNEERQLCKRPKDGCSRPSSACLWVYEEVRPEDPLSGVSGGLDGLVSFGGEKLVLIECKIMAVDMFKELKAPLAEHRLRTQLYLTLVEKAGLEQIRSDLGIVLYISRGFGNKDDEVLTYGTGDRFSPFKQFIVKRDDERVEPLLEKARAVKEARENGTIPVGICRNMRDRRASQCSIAKQCFSGEYPANG